MVDSSTEHSAFTLSFARLLITGFSCILIRFLRRRIRRLAVTWNQISPIPVITILRKEVIQPQVPLRLPCYDLVPLTEFTFGASFPKVRSATTGVPCLGGLTGGVYKAQEHIHRGMLTRDY